MRAAAWASTSVRAARIGLSVLVALPRRNRRTGSPAANTSAAITTSSTEEIHGGRRQQPAGAEVDASTPSTTAPPRPGSRRPGATGAARVPRSPCVVQQVALGAGTDARACPSPRAGRPPDAPRPRPAAPPRGRPASHGTRTKARSWARGWGRASVGVVHLHVGVEGRVAVLDQVEVERARHPSGSRACGRARARCRAGSAAAPAAPAEVVPTTTALRYAGWSGPPTGSVSTTGETASMSTAAERARRTAWCRVLERLAEVGAEGDDHRGLALAPHAHLHVSEGVRPPAPAACAPRPRRPRPGAGSARSSAIRSASASIRSRDSPSIRATTSAATSA